MAKGETRQGQHHLHKEEEGTHQIYSKRIYDTFIFDRLSMVRKMLVPIEPTLVPIEPTMCVMGKHNLSHNLGRFLGSCLKPPPGQQIN